MALIALLDANVLVNAAVRDTILRAAEADLFRLAFSRAILAEMKRALESNLGLMPQQTDYLIDELMKSFGAGVVEGYEDLIPQMRNPEEDHHVLAAAVWAGAVSIVTLPPPLPATYPVPLRHRGPNTG